MRRPLLLAFALLLLLPLAGPARADDEEAIARLENRVEMLLDLVAELRKEVVDLRTRVTELEVALAQAPAEPIRELSIARAEPRGAKPIAPRRAGSGEQLPADPIPEMSKPRPEDIPGAYVIDRRASIDAIVARAVLTADSPEEEAAIREMAEQTFESVEMKLELNADGSFAASVSGMGDEARTAGGTWTLAGETITLLTTHEDGVAKEKADDEIRGTWKEGRFTLSEDDDEFVVVFVRQK